MENPVPPPRAAGGARLRETARLLRTLPLDRLPTDPEWDDVAGELTNDELKRLDSLAEGHLERALEAEKPSDALDEATNAVLLRPRDVEWGRRVVNALRERRLAGDEAHAFYAAVERRGGRRRGSGGSKLRWWIPAAALLLLSAGLVVWLLLGGPGAGSHRPLGTGPRALETSIDTQGIKANTQIASSRLQVFSEATVAELSAWVTFPDHRVDLWEGTVSVVDPQGQVLTSRPVTFRASNQGPVDPGQGLEIFQQFDAWPWFDRAAGFQIATTRIVAKETNPRDRVELPLGGVSLSPGWSLKVWQLDHRWSERFASKVHNLELEVENAGLKPFAELNFVLKWVSPDGAVLKQQTFRPVSAFRTALPTGARLSWSQETVFDTEVFQWSAGGEPHPVLELASWQ